MAFELLLLVEVVGVSSEWFHELTFILYKQT